MNNIQNQFPLTGYRQNSPTDYRSAGYIKEQSFTSSETLNTDLVIHTKEGDTVTINSSSFSNLDAYTYNSKGMVQSEAGLAVFQENSREITLANGQSLSFSVEGDLSEDELKDIDSMLQGLDSVITDLKAGDMAGAMKSALGLGEFDTFSAYSADINYEQSVDVTTTTAAVANTMQEEMPAGATEKLDPGSEALQQNAVPKPDSIFDKLLEKFSQREDKLLQAVQSPSNNLFQRHINELQGNSQQFDSLVGLLEGAMSKFESFFEKISDDNAVTDGSDTSPEVDD